jgi:hypothetical protein
MLCFPWSRICIGSGSNQWLTTSVVEVLRVRCLCNSWMRFWCMSQCWTAYCCHCLWHGYQHCQDPETFGFNHKKVILPVSKSSNCNNIRPFTPPKVHP